MPDLVQTLCRLRAAPRLAARLLRHGIPRRLVLFGPLSLGDDLLCTAIFRELRRRGQDRLWMMSRHPEFFAHNGDVDRVVPIDEHHARLLTWLGTTVTRPYAFGASPDGNRMLPPPRPLIAQMCALSGVTGEVELRPWLHLTSEERARGRLAARQIVMHSSGQSAKVTMANKEWGSARFQEVATGLAARGFEVIQLGAQTDPPLASARDLRGRTTFRESAAIVAGAQAVVCQVGFLMHLARAVEARAVVIFGGVEDPAISGYAANENLTSQPPCATCWLPNDCPHGKACMAAISSRDVIAAVERQVGRSGEPLPLGTCTI